MPPTPTLEEIRALARQLRPAQLLLLPFYHELENEVKHPDRVRMQTEYFWRQWAPKLGPTLTVLVITLRGYCYYNKLTKETRDWCFPEQETLAREVGVSIRTVRRELTENPLTPLLHPPAAPIPLRPPDQEENADRRPLPRRHG